MTEQQKQTRMQKRQQQTAPEETTDIQQPIVTVNFGSWIMRILVVVVLVAAAAVLGAMIGYGGIGDGNPMQVLNPGTWTHIFDIMNGKTE